MGNESNNSGMSHILSVIISLKIKIGIIISIIVFFFIIIVPIILLMIISNNQLIDDEKEGEDSLSSSEVENTGIATTQVIERNGLLFPTEKSYFCYPVVGSVKVVQQFGKKGSMWKNGHTGTDFVGPRGTNLVAVCDGIVYSINSCGSSYGNHVILMHMIQEEEKSVVFYTMYCHMKEKTILQKGQTVKQGQVLGVQGSTGNSSGEHCHFEFSYKPGMYKNSLDSMLYLYQEKVLNEAGILKHTLSTQN